MAWQSQEVYLRELSAVCLSAVARHDSHAAGQAAAPRYDSGARLSSRCRCWRTDVVDMRALTLLTDLESVVTMKVPKLIAEVESDIQSVI